MKSNEELDFLDKLIDKANMVIEKYERIEKPDKVWLDNAAAEEWLGVSSRTLHSYRNKGLIPFSQVGAKIWYRFSDLQDFLSKNRV